MNYGVSIRLFVHENRKHQEVLVTDWLLQYARQAGFHGATVFKTTTSFGRRAILHGDSMWNVLGTGTEVVEFLLTPQAADELLATLRRENIDVFYVATSCSFGNTLPLP